MGLAERVMAGDRVALARLLSLVVEARDELDGEMESLLRMSGRAHVIGITGPPGSGKSSLIASLAREFRGRRKTVGVVAVDPTSPLSGGAVLGDRVRMQSLLGDPGVFVRSLASRGSPGGIAGTAADAVRVLDAAGYELVFLETVGAGQAEVEVARVAHSVVLLEVPGMGDEVQAIKAGVLEMADIFVVNKAEREGADRLVRALRLAVQGAGAAGAWVRPVLKTTGSTGAGIGPLADALEAHLAHLRESGQWDARVEAGMWREAVETAREQFATELLAGMRPEEVEALKTAVRERRMTPREAGKLLIKKFRGVGSPSRYGDMSRSLK